MASVFLGDLDDFIQPSQSCINPMFSTEDEKEVGVVQISIASDAMEVQPDLIKTDASSKTATVSLNDCLACSGCVTSAETVLITQQSVDEFLKVMEQRQELKKVVVSIAPQARASIAKHFGLSAAQVQSKLRTFFKTLGVDLVLDTTASGDFSLIETANEFVTRFRQQKPLEWKKPPISLAESSTKTIFPQGDENMEQDPYSAIPMLASACPGWVCYAEKSQQNVLPYISTTKSPQQIMGTLVKHVLFAAESIASDQIYHVSIMPCYDKKLEASRKDFLDEMASSRDVDTVLTSGEIIDLLELKQVDLRSVADSIPCQEELLLSGVSVDGNTLVGATTGQVGSGGFLEFVFRYAARELFQVDVTGPLEYVQGRNQDIREVKLIVNEKTVLCFAQAFGFRNIQGVVTKIRRKKCPYHFVEIMACPGGCLNGGGQIKPPVDSSAQQVLGQVEEIFNDRVLRSPYENPACKQLYQTQLGTPFSDKARQLLHTRYHAVPKLELSNPLGIKW